MIKKLKLFNFRNHFAKTFSFEKKLVVFVGNNGVGKTNILEAISFLTSGRGLKSAKLSEVLNFQNENEKTWAVFAEIENDGISEEIGTQLSYTKETNKEKRISKINGEQISSQHELNNYVNIFWLTPDMDNVFNLGTTSRRHFLDRICEFFFPNYSDLMGAYNKLRSERLKLILKNYHNNSEWISAIEKQMVEKAVAIAFERNEAIEKLNTQTNKIEETAFPSFNVSVDGEIEKILLEKKAIEVEKYYSEKLFETRHEDWNSKKTNFGIHKSDFVVMNKVKNLPAQICSTGEQKAMLMSIAIATILARAAKTKRRPIILLDEVASHLDEKRRLELFELLKNIDCQCFMTGTDEGIFAPVIDTGQILKL